MTVRRLHPSSGIPTALPAAAWLAVAVALAGCADADPGAQPVLEVLSIDSVETVTQWTPVEWVLPKLDVEEDPYDLEAWVDFVHEESGERRRTGMFFDGESSWRFRFTGTLPGRWTFTTSSADADLNGRNGVVLVSPAPDGAGFVRAAGNRWARQVGVEGELRSYLPQFLMYRSPAEFGDSRELVRRDIRIFMRDHGFTGFHVPVLCRWFDLEQEDCNEISADPPSPDPRTFHALEMLIRDVHAAGGSVHLWAWGDKSRGQTPSRWGLNGSVDRRLQRYIAARLGPLPGWTMGYGFDLFEWVDPDEVRVWNAFLQDRMGWPHLLGARGGTGELEPRAALGYASYEQHRPGLEEYVAAFEADRSRPAFSEDRFRIREDSPYPAKDYDMIDTRRGLWRSAMAGGVANIWGQRVARPGQDPDLPPYERPEWIRTNATFFQRHFDLDMERDAEGGATALRSRNGTRMIIYAEEADAVLLPFSRLAEPGRVVAVDALATYREIELGVLCPEDMTWRPPHRSDWAIAAGDFEGRGMADGEVACAALPLRPEEGR